MPPGDKYSPADRRQAMVIYASQAGREETTRQMLAEVGLGHVKFETLRGWVRRYRKDEYEQIRQEYESYLRSEAADQFRAVAELSREVGGEALRQLAVALKNGEVTLKELPKVAQSAMVAAGIATDKGELLSGNPTSIVKTDVGDLQRELASVGVTIILPGQPKPDAIDVQPKPTAELPAGA